MKKKILFLDNHDASIYNMRRELVMKLIEEQYEVILCVPNGERIPDLIELGCKFEPVNLERHSTNPIKELNLIRQYFKIVKRLMPDLILTYTIKPNIYMGFVARKFKIDYIANVTGLGTALYKEGLIKKIILIMYQNTLLKAKKVFFQNESNLKFAVNTKIIDIENTKVIPGSGVNLENHKFEMYPTNEDKIHFIFIGRLMRDKGIFELIEAIVRLNQVHNNLEFHVLGYAEEDNILNKIQEINNIYYHGSQKNVHPFLTNSHAIIHPSYHEGLSNVLLEAASTGRPIIASNIPGCNETFDEGITGFGFEPKNVESLVNAVEKFLQLTIDERAIMGEKGRAKIEKEFDRAVVVDTYLNEINKIMNIQIESTVKKEFDYQG